MQLGTIWRLTATFAASTCWLCSALWLESRFSAGWLWTVLLGSSCGSSAMEESAAPTSQYVTSTRTRSSHLLTRRAASACMYRTIDYRHVQVRCTNRYILRYRRFRRTRWTAHRRRYVPGYLDVTGVEREHLLQLFWMMLKEIRHILIT